MAQTRFTCTLTQADEPACQTHARVTIMDSEGASARACPRDAVAALDGITDAQVDWADSRGLNEWERKALELSEERSKLAYGIGTIGGPLVTDGLTARTERPWYPDRPNDSWYPSGP